jgi:alpha-beta hydrolase superfamily lysophospholipase
MKQYEGMLTSADGLQLYYQSWQPGPPPRAALVIVHGFGGHSGMFSHITGYLIPLGYAVYGLDLRGYGRSAGQRGYINSWADYRADVRACLDKARSQYPLLPLFLMGHSLGGVIVLEYVLRFPEGIKGVVASAPALGQVSIPAYLWWLSRLLSRWWPRFSRRTGSNNVEALTRDPAVLEAYAADPLLHSLGTARLGTEFSRAVAWTNAHAAELRLPLLMLHGEDDRIAAPEGSRVFFEQVTYANKTYQAYPGAYHELHNDIGYPQFLSDLAAWLEQQVGPGL